VAARRASSRCSRRPQERGRASGSRIRPVCSMYVSWLCLATFLTSSMSLHNRHGVGQSTRRPGLLSRVEARRVGRPGPWR
jgi:hypothetical protein